MVTFINIILTFILKGHLETHRERGKLERVNNMQSKELDLNLGLLQQGLYSLCLWGISTTK